MPARDVAATFIRWTFVRAALARGYWLVASLYLVVEADLSAFQLVFIGVAQGITRARVRDSHRRHGRHDQPQVVDRDRARR